MQYHLIHAQGNRLDINGAPPDLFLVWYLDEEVIDFSKKAEVETVAEGVETEEQAEFLRSCGCTKLQGFLYSRPLPLDELTDMYLR